LGDALEDAAGDALSLVKISRIFSHDVLKLRSSSPVAHRPTAEEMQV
jgi:hypothetical protein